MLFPKRTPTTIDLRQTLPAWLLHALLAGLLCGLATGCDSGSESAVTGETADSSPAQTLELILPDDLDQAADIVTADRLRSDIAILSSDEMRGRGPGNPGDVMARDYIAQQMAAMGLEPAGVDGTWEQPFDIVSVTADVPSTWTLETSEGDFVLSESDQFIAFSGLQEDTASIEEAELVFVGYGIVAPEYDWDDYKGIDLSGKVLVMMNNDPNWSDDLFAGNRRLYYGRWNYKYESAAAQGAVGAIIIHTTPSAGYGWNVIQTSWTGERVELPAGDESRIAIGAWTTEDATRQYFAAAGFDLDELRERAKQRDFEPVPLGITTSLTLDNSIRRTQTANVLGKLPGSDPELADEYVVYSAHHDHIGDGGSGDDPIYNGALDNAAGVAQILAIARAMQQLEVGPRRSILFNFVGAEESGLLGSEFWANNPTVSPGRVAANINYDGGNIWGMTRDVTYIGFGKSSLDDVVLAAAASQNRTVSGDQFPDRGFFYRSDQFNFAKIGIPAIYLDTGTDFVDHESTWGKEQIEAWEADHYHQPSDELVDSWVWDGMIADVELGLMAGMHISDTQAFPEWKPGDEFEAARKAALANVPAETD